jgi:hypothetical protein
VLIWINKHALASEINTTRGDTPQLQLDWPFRARHSRPAGAAMTISDSIRRQGPVRSCLPVALPAGPT